MNSFFLIFFLYFPLICFLLLKTKRILIFTSKLTHLEDRTTFSRKEGEILNGFKIKFSEL